LEQGFAVQSFGDGVSPLGALDTAGNIDVIVPDWRLPKTSGINVLLRRQGISFPLVLLTDLVHVADECLAFDGEANDLKSRGAEVLARRLGGMVEALKSTDQPRSDKAMLCGKLLLRPDFRRAYWNEVDLDLTLGEYNIVHLLASNVGRYVSYRNVYDCLRQMVSSQEKGHWAIGRMCGPQSSVSEASFELSTRLSIRSRTTLTSDTAGRSQPDAHWQPTEFVTHTTEVWTLGAL
jgi:two-component system response regulator ChvI